MKATKRRVLSFVMALLTVITTVFGHVDYNVKAEETTTWSKVELSDISSEDTVMITMTAGDVTYALSAKEKNSKGAPLAKSVAVSDNTATTNSDTDFAWNIKTTDGSYYIMNGDNYLYVTNANNGVRVGKPQNANVNIWSQNGDYLSASDGTNIRYLGVYDATDWRCYTNTDNNIKGQTLGFWKLNTSDSGETENPGTETPSTQTPSTEDPSQEVTISTISDALAATEGEFTVKGVVTLVDGQNIYVQDETGAICVRMSTTPSDIALGDTIIGTGSKTVYNGLPQLGSGTYEKSEGLTLSAKETTIDALTTADIATYVEIKNVEVTAIDDNGGKYTTPNVTVTDGTNSIQIYKAVVGKTDGTNWDIQVGEKINVKAAVSVYKTTLQLRNTLATEITEAAPEPTYDKISDALAATEGEFTVKGVVTLVDSQNIYIQDATGAICVRMTAKPTDIALGDTIIGSGSKTVYNGLPQLGSGTYEKSTGLTLSAKETTIDALTTADIATYVQIKNVEVTEVYDKNGTYSAPNITVTDGTNSIQIYKAVVNKADGTNWDVKVGDKIDVKAAVGINKTTLQLRNTLATEITEAAPAPTYDKISDALAATEGNFTVKGVVTLVDGQNIYVQDATGAICVRMTAKPTDIALGDTIIGSGSKTVYNGLPQLGSGTYEKSAGLSLTAKATTIDSLTTADIATYVQIKNVEVTEVYDKDGTYSNPNITVTDGTNSIQIYKAVVNKTDGTNWDVKVGDKIDIKAAVSINKTTLQLRNTLASEITEAVETDGLGKVTSADQLISGTYVIVSKDGYAPTVLNGNWVEVAQPVIEGNIVTEANGTVWTLTVDGNEVMLTDSQLQTIAPTGGNANGIKSGSYKWAWSFNEEKQTFTFKGQGVDTVALATNDITTGDYPGYHRIRAYKNTTLSGSGKNNYCSEFTLYKVDPSMDAPKTDVPKEGSKVVIYNVAAKGILTAQDDNVESPSIKGVAATVEANKATAANGGVVFKVEKNGEFFRFYNETYGYLCSKGTGNNAYYSLEACDEADWVLEELGGGFKMKSNVAKYNDKYAQYLEYFSESYKTYSYYGTNKDGTPADTTIYEFHFYECANEKLTNGIVNEPTVVTGTLLDAYVGTDYTFTFEVDAPFGVKELEVSLNNNKLDYTEELGVYTVTVPADKISGEKLEVVVSGTDNKDVTFSSKIEVAVKDEPVILAVTPASGAETGSEKRPVISAEIVNAGEKPTVEMTINEEKVDAVYADGKISYTAASDMEDARYSVTVTVTRADGKTASKTWAFTVGKANYQLYFGQLHSHTTFSDGSGSLQSALDYVTSLPESANVDFVAFTDHSNYFDKSGAANPEGALYDMNLATEYSQGVWKEYKDTVAEFNASQSDIVALAGFEMTWSGGPGHMNTFNTPGIVSRNNTTLNNKTNDAGMKAYYALLSQAEGADLIAQFNHPGSTFGTFADFSYWDALIDSRINLVEVGNGEGQVGSGGYFPSFEYYTMALDKGWHVAPTNNQDNHKGKWGNANDARDVILTDNFTEEGIYQAMRDMRMYATEDKNLELYYTVNGYQLGSSITEVPEKLDINVVVNDPDASDSISKVEVIVNSGKTAYTWDNKAELTKGELTCTLDPVYSYYYIRVTEGDGDLAVTAPVWVGEALKLGISSVECGTSTPVTNEELALTTNLFNSESEDATVKSLTYTVNGSQLIGVDTNSYTIPASGSKDIEFKFTPTVAKLTKITVTAVVEQKQQEYTFTMDITVDVQDATKLVYIGIDAAHYNEYVAGNYANSMGNFSALAADYAVRTVELKSSEELIAACSNDKYKALILTAPSRRLAASFTDPRTYSAEEIAALVAFNNNGGCVILAGWSDHYENPSKTGNTTGNEFTHMAATQNEVLKALGSSLRISDDATYDDSYNGGQQYRLYFNTYGDNFLTEGIEVDSEHLHDRLYTEVFSHYGGASVYAVDGNGNAVSVLPETVSPVVYAHSTTYSVDADEDGLGASNIPKYSYADGDNRLLAMAMEEIEGKGAIIVSGAAFMSNFEVQATIEDSGSEKNYSNYRICENLVQHINPTVVTPIAEVQAQTEAGYKYTIEGIVTSNASGYDKDTAFFDCIYVQDETGGVCCFPVAGNYKIGDKVRVTGTTDFYQGEMELQVTSIEAIGTGSVTPTVVTSAQVNDGSVLGQLITVNGTVVSFEEANGLVQTIMVKDADGNVCRVFIDGYITTSEDVKNLKIGNKITVTGIASFDDTFNAPDGPFPRIRIRDRADIICTEESTSTEEGGSNESGSSTEEGGSNESGSSTGEGESNESGSSTEEGGSNNSASSTEEGESNNSGPSTGDSSSNTETDTALTTPVGNTSANRDTVTNNPNTVEITDEEIPLASNEEAIKVVISAEENLSENTEKVIEVLNKVEEGETVIIELPALTDTNEKATVVSTDIFETIAGKDVTLVLELANGITWTINGQNVDLAKLSELQTIDLNVTFVESVVPENLVNEIVNESQESIQISLSHNGEFGFDATLTIEIGNKYAGKEVTLYYFNEDKNVMEQQGICIADENGNVTFEFSHASDYVLVIGTASTSDIVDVEIPLVDESVEESKGNMELPIVAGLSVILIALLVVIYMMKQGKFNIKK